MAHNAKAGFSHFLPKGAKMLATAVHAKPVQKAYRAPASHLSAKSKFSPSPDLKSKY